MWYEEKMRTRLMEKKRREWWLYLSSSGLVCCCQPSFAAVDRHLPTTSAARTSQQALWRLAVAVCLTEPFNADEPPCNRL